MSRASALRVVSARTRLMATSRSTERKTPRFGGARTDLANKPWTALSQEHEVGVKWKTKHASSLGGAVI